MYYISQLTDCILEHLSQLNVYFCCHPICSISLILINTNQQIVFSLIISLRGFLSIFQKVVFNFINLLIIPIQSMKMQLKESKQPQSDGKHGSNIDYHIIEMGSRFPFGGLQAVRDEQTKILVRKKLTCSSKSQSDSINKTASLLQDLRNPNLINFHHLEKEEGLVYFYYEYAHLALEKWILDLGDDMWQILKNQMLDLAVFLNKNLIFFTFDENCIGLNKNISVKYFLSEFSLMDCKEVTMRNKNLAYNRGKIEKYFAKFKEMHEEENPINIFRSVIVENNQKCADNESMLCSITTRESWTLIPPKTSRILEPRGKSKSRLTEKLQESKMKTHLILQKLKNIKNLQF